ncbi:MAG TPA: tetratricopeptide repeat protein [Blastocatellia bacterium]|nr:tetratricopeptide repeat protein [Blastocatellia bacterium]
MRTVYYLSCALILLLSPAASAQTDERNMEKEELIWQRLQAIAPRSVETFKAATVALDGGDYDKAARLYEEVYKKAPDFDPVMRRLGLSLIATGRREEGMGLLEMAVSKARSPENLISLAQFLAFPGEEKRGPRQDMQRALLLTQEAAGASKEDDPTYWAMAAQLSIELDRVVDLREATRMLVKNYPDTLQAHYYSAVVAATDGDWIKAEDEIKKAQSLGLPAEVANEILGSGIQTKATVWRYAYYTLYLLAGWAAGLALLFVLGKAFSKMTLRWIEAADPNADVGGNDLPIRKYYRWLINIAGVYYYVSIPVVAFLVLAIAASITYGFFMVGRIPIYLIFALITGSVVTVYKMIRSLFIKVEIEESGRSLREDEAPGLWALAREVAQAVNTRPVDEIRVTPGTDMAVYERGSFKERMQDRARRTLILGVGTLNGFNQNAFRAVLAHEYGHFRHRDTAGGDVAIRVNNDMMKFAVAMIEGGQAVWWNVAFQFLRLYHFLFRRISHGATRLQEMLADRVAARRYSPQAFEDGLTHIIRREVEFEDIAYWEITNANKARRAVQNLYELKASEEQRVEEKIKETVNRPTSEDDTHPSPAERFRLARRVTYNDELPPAGMVWDLFANREAVTDEMSSLINKYAKAVSGG